MLYHAISCYLMLSHLIYLILFFLFYLVWFIHLIHLIYLIWLIHLILSDLNVDLNLNLIYQASNQPAYIPTYLSTCIFVLWIMIIIAEGFCSFSASTRGTCSEAGPRFGWNPGAESWGFWSPGSLRFGWVKFSEKRWFLGINPMKNPWFGGVKNFTHRKYGGNTRI